MKKSIDWDDPYVRRRMEERGVTEKDIEYAIEHRHVQMPGRKGRKRIFSYMGNRCLNIVIKETKNRIYVITVAWRGE